MNTTAINYKNVFQLAENKGYVPRHNISIISKMDRREFEEQRLFEITLIQKWLRDTHKIIVLVRPFNLGKSYFTSVLAPNIDRDFTTSEKENYESALLEGITEALQLI